MGGAIHDANDDRHTDPPTYETATSRVWHLRTADTTQGRTHEQRVEHAPGSPFPPEHLHPDQDEHFEVEHGEMLFVVAGEERLVLAGGWIDIPRGTPHKARNASSSEPAVVRWETTPALRTGEFFLTAASLGDDPGLLASALLASEYRDVLRVTGLAGALVPLLARVARWSGRTLPAPLPTT